MSWIDQVRQEHGWFGHGRAPEYLRFAQAGRADMASDVRGDGAVRSSSVGYVAADPRQWLGRDPIGTGECVDLVKAAANTPRTPFWRAGRLVQGDGSIRPGTIIATFDETGRYTGHAAIYMGQDQRGLTVIDQWNVRDRAGTVILQQQPAERTLTFGNPRRAMINRGESYRVVE